MSNEGQNGNGAAPATAQPAVQVLAQYIKDLSFENPGAPQGLTQNPQIEFGVNLQARQNDGTNYEVELKLRIHATVQEKQLFLLELTYAGLFRLENIPEDALQPLLMIQAPHMLFPFARRIVADVVRDGGMPPLMVEPIDFAALYQARVKPTTLKA